MKLIDLFSGIGAFSLGLQRAGFQPIGFTEINPYCRAVLRKHWPDVPIREDVRSNTYAAGDADALCAGFPCQDISIAGPGAGLAGPRSGLWSEVVRAVRLVRPRLVALENVAALLKRGLATVLGDLAALGYDTEWNSVPAACAGAPQPRDRVWIAAYPAGERAAGLVASADFGAAGPWGPRGAPDLQSVADAPFEPGDRWPQPLLRRNDDGTASRVDRVGACGNSLIPQIAEVIGRSLITAGKRE